MSSHISPKINHFTEFKASVFERRRDNSFQATVTKGNAIPPGNYNNKKIPKVTFMLPLGQFSTD